MKLMFSIFAILIASISFGQTNGQKLSVKYFNAVKSNSPDADGIYAELGNLGASTLSEELDSDEKILAFWINIYNTSVQYILKKDPSKFNDRGAFFKAKQINIAGEVLSFDVIEHGILRRSKSKLSLGYFRKLNVSSFEKLMRIRKVDPRIHYALNCGAKSCPPIAPYHADKVNEELDASTKKYLMENGLITETELNVPVLFSWFRADFGGKRGIKKFLLNYGVIMKSDKSKELKFLDYDWTLALDPYYAD
jgi:hypothetical protein